MDLREGKIAPAHHVRRHGGSTSPSLPVRLIILLVRFYQNAVSPWLGRRCRFHPTCSQYCIEALKQHGMVLGLWFGMKRICKCHPLHPGGVDPVPEPKS